MKQRIFFPFLLFAGSLAAHPQGFQLAAGDASAPIVDDQGKMVVQSGSKAIVNWDSFSIAAAEQIHFQQEGATSSILNRVTGSQGSDLFGLLSSNGRVFLINPNGVFIGQTGRIDTADFLASTFDVLDVDFLQEKDLLFCGGSDKSIQNLGTISCPTGNIHLFAAQIVNIGEIQSSSGKVFLAAGGDILLQKDGASHVYIRPELTQEKVDGAAIDNQGSIEAMVVSLEAGDSPYAKAVRCSGTIATSVEKIGGEVYLVAKKGITEIDGGTLTAPGGVVHVLGEKVGLQNESRIDVSAPSGEGTVLIGGDFQGGNPEIQNAAITYVSKESEIRADAFENGPGGKVIVWSDMGTYAYGKFSARGGPTGGDGGLVEVSGSYLDFQGFSDTTAPQGRIGTLLLDPQTISISAAGNSNFTPPFNFDGPICAGTATGTLDGTLSGIASNISTATLTGAGGLANNCVTINTSAASSGIGAGSITVQPASPISWTAATTLTLIADAIIMIDSSISNTVVSATPFIAMNFTALGGANGVGSTSAGILTTAAGSLTCPNAPGDIILTGKGGTGATNQIGVITSAAITTQGSVTITGTAGGNGTGLNNHGVDIGGPITAGLAGSAANITITGTGGNGTSSVGFGCIGVLIASPFLLNGTGSVTLSGTGGTGPVGVNDGESVGLEIETTITANAGSIDFINCIGGTSPGGDNFGVFIEFSTLSAVNITASNIQGGAVGANNIGFGIDSTTIKSSTTGNISISGTGTNGAAGVSFDRSNTVQTAGSGTITINGTGSPGILISNANNPSLNDFISVNGNMSFIGSVSATGAFSSNNFTATGSGSISFSSSIDSAVPLVITSTGGSVSVLGSIGSVTPPASITIQPGSGISVNPILGTVPNGTVTFGGSSVISSGAISISAAGRTQPMSIATIIGTGNLTMTGSSVTMGANESMTVLGNLLIDGAITIGDVVAAGNLVITGSSVTLHPQAPALYLASTGKFYTSPSAHIFGLNLPSITPPLPPGSRVFASGFLTEASYASFLKFGPTVLNWDIHSIALPVVQAVVNQLQVANSQLVANGTWGLLPTLDLRFFPIYAICGVSEAEAEEDELVCDTGVFVPFIYESDIVDGNIFRAL